MRAMVRAGWKTGLLALLVIEFVVFGALNEYFLNADNLLYSVGDFLHIAVAALPMTLVIITGGIDISVGATMGFGSIVTALLWYKGLSIWLGAAAALAAGALLGLFNAFLILATGVNPLVITLGSSFLISGVALILSGLAGATGFEGISGLPEQFSNLVNGMMLRIPNPVWILAAAVVVFYVILHKMNFGRCLLLVGMNPAAARYSGLRTHRTIMLAYMTMGIGAAFSGILLTSYFTSARSDLGADSALAVITCAVLGGASIYGGSGDIIGTLMASLLIGYLKYGLQMVGVSSQATSVYLGMVLICAIAGRYLWDKYYGALVNRRALSQGARSSASLDPDRA